MYLLTLFKLSFDKFFKFDNSNLFLLFKKHCPWATLDWKLYYYIIEYVHSFHKYYYKL